MISKQMLRHIQKTKFKELIQENKESILKDKKRMEEIDVLLDEKHADISKQ